MALTRRQTLEMGAAAFAASLIRPASVWGREPDLFEMALDGHDGVRAASAGRWRTTEVLRAPGRFDLVGLRWNRGREFRAQVRARPRRGTWSRWVDLPHPHAPLDGTDPAWTGPCEFFQLRLHGDARGLRARFVRVGPRRARIAKRRQDGGTHAPGQQPAIVTRDQWGGEQVPPRAAPSYGEVNVAFVHHTAGTNGYDPEDSAAIVLGIAKYHRNSNGWNDIGYNFLVDKYGQIFEGRAGGMDLAVIGAQAEGWNSLSTGIACLGTFEEVTQSEAGLEALARLLGWKLSLHGVPAEGQVTLRSGGGSTNRYSSGTRATFERISGHRDGNRTACPGELLYGQLAELRRRAGAYTTSLSAITLAPASSRVAPRTPVDVTGELRFSDGSSPQGARIEIQFQPSGGAWQTVATTSAAADGAWQASVTPDGSGELRAFFPGDGSRQALTSSEVAISVRGRIRMKIRPRRLRRGRKIRIAGTVDPLPFGGRLEVRLERQLSSGRWVFVRTKRIRVRSGGAYSTRLKISRAGRHRVWVVSPDAVRSGLVRGL